MKKLIFILALFCGYNGISQTAADPELTAPTIDPSPGQLVGDVTTFCITLQQEVPIAVPYDSFDPTQIVMSTNKFTPDETFTFFDFQEMGQSSYFDWDFECVSNCGTVDAIWVITGSQNQVIPACTNPLLPCPSQEYCFQGVILDASTILEANSNNGHGFNVNLVPCSLADCDQENGPESNNQSRYTFTSASPVTWSGFEVISKGNDGRLNWSTASEVDNSHFEVERSLDGRTFVSIGEAKGNGTTTSKSSYEFTDRGIGLTSNGSKVYYRIKQNDYDGKYDYSDVKWIRFGESAGIIVYPNPTRGKVMINLGSLEKYIISISSSTGKLIEKVYYKNGNNLDISAYPEGVYNLRFIDEKGIELGNTRLLKI